MDILETPEGRITLAGDKIRARYLTLLKRCVAIQPHVQRESLTARSLKLEPFLDILREIREIEAQVAVIEQEIAANPL